MSPKFIILVKVTFQSITFLSTATSQLIEVLDDWTKFLDDKKIVDVIYFDFQKAFDTVPHKRLIGKLYSYGIRGRLLNWIENFLKDRKQRVLLDGQTSNWSDVTSGIPQGSVLGPHIILNLHQRSPRSS